MQDGSQRPSIEMASVTAGRVASPPAPPSGVNMRAWFAGLALGNPELMKDVLPENRAIEALRLADQLMTALAPKVPTLASMAAPSDAEMQVWEAETSTRTRVTAAPQKQKSPSLSRIPTEPGIPAPACVNRGDVVVSPDVARPVPPRPSSQTDSTTTRPKWAGAGLPRSVRPALPQKPPPGTGTYSHIADE